MNTIAFPKHSNWEERSDLVYAPALRKAPLILDSDQQLETHQGEESGVEPTIQGSGDAGDLYQHTTSRTLNRYKLLKSNVISESKHTIKLKNGSVIRESAVAVKPKILPKKRKPATLKEMVASEKKGAIESPKSKRPKAKQALPVATYQSESSDSEVYQPLKIIPAELSVEISARHEAIAAGQGPSSSRIIQEEHGVGTRVKTKTTKVKRGKGNQDRPALVAREQGKAQEEGSQSTKWEE